MLWFLSNIFSCFILRHFFQLFLFWFSLPSVFLFFFLPFSFSSSLCHYYHPCISNAMVLVVLIRARRQFGSSVHTLIANQSAMDLFASASAISILIVMVTRGFRYSGNRIADGALCVIVEAGVPTAVGLTAEIIGLVVITLERYFKIVHAIAHRKHYRDWMTTVSVALPWIGGVCLILFPAMGTTRIVNGRCLRLSVWPNEAMMTVSTNILLWFSAN